jgi:hypothetical protein
VRKTNSLRDIFTWAGLDPTVFARRFNAAYAAGWRENRKRIRAAKREAKHRAYAVNGLNGPRACERRARQWDAIEAKRAAHERIKSQWNRVWLDEEEGISPGRWVAA